MNNFTKDELIVLQQAFNGACKAFSNDEFDAKLELKIQSMIDNYCEHINYEKLYTSCGGVENFECKDCGCQFINEAIAYKKNIVGVADE